MKNLTKWLLVFAVTTGITAGTLLGIREAHADDGTPSTATFSFTNPNGVKFYVTYWREFGNITCNAITTDNNKLNQSAYNASISCTSR